MKFLKQLVNENQQEHERAVNMINAAVEAHTNNFDAIADVDSLVKFLRGRYRDFSSQIEQTIREIIASELGHEEEEEMTRNDPWSDWPTRERDPYGKTVRQPHKK